MDDMKGTIKELFEYCKEILKNREIQIIHNMKTIVAIDKAETEIVKLSNKKFLQVIKSYARWLSEDEGLSYTTTLSIALEKLLAGESEENIIGYFERRLINANGVKSK